MSERLHSESTQPAFACFSLTPMGFWTPVRWKVEGSLLPFDNLVRLDIRFAGIRPEDCRLHAMSVVGQ